MPTTVTKYRYITKDMMIQGGEPVIRGMRFPVRSVVVHVLKEGMLPEELAKEFPQLTLAAIYEALSYYYDHRGEIDSLIAEQKEVQWRKRA